MSNQDEVTLTFHLPETDFSALDVELALAAIRPLLPASRHPVDPTAYTGILCAYEILQRIWQRYHEAVPEATWLDRYPPLSELWGETGRCACACHTYQGTYPTSKARPCWVCGHYEAQP